MAAPTTAPAPATAKAKIDVATIATPTVEELEKLVFGDDNVDRLGASMCACDAGDDNPF